MTATRYHSLAVEPDTVTPDELEVTAATDTGGDHGAATPELAVEGVQFHPESVLTEGASHAGELAGDLW